MNHHHHHRPQKPPTGRTNLASCIVATIFLIFLVMVILIVFFTVFKPKEPKIAVNAVQLPTFSISNATTVNFIFSQYVSVRNPNRAVFTHYDSSLQLIYSGNQVGFMFIPAGNIDAGRTQYISATFSVQSFPLTTAETTTTTEAAVVTNAGPTISGGFDGSRMGPTLEIESRMRMAGRVRVLRFFTHHVEGRAGCRVGIAVSDGSVQGFHC